MARPSKAQSQHAHAKRRAFERYELELNDQDLRDLIRLIQGSKATLVEKQSHRVRVYDVEFKERLVRVVYDSERKSIASFLPFVDLRYTVVD